MKTRIFILMVFVVASSCGGNKRDPDPAAAPVTGNLVKMNDVQMKNAEIVTGHLEQKEISSILKVNGKVDVPPQNMVSISAPLGGYLKSTRLIPGMRVSRGDVIAVLEDQHYIQLQQDYLTAKTRIRFLESEYRRQKELNESKASSDKIYQQAESDYRTEQVLMTALGEKLKMAGIDINTISETNIKRSVNIYAPINGYVSKVNVNIGRYISPTEVLFELIDPRDIHLALKVFEKDLDKLYIGQKLEAFTNNDPNIKSHCTILLIGRDLSADRNAEVHCHFESYEKRLVPGTYMNAEIRLVNKESRVLPEEAIVRFENKQYVFIKNADNTFNMTEIKTGNSEKGFIEIMDAAPLQSKEFVIHGAYSLLMSLKNKSDQ
jgi:cobalt-zinc-cadmium efflux system membrane fusion protein